MNPGQPNFEPANPMPVEDSLEQKNKENLEKRKQSLEKLNRALKYLKDIPAKQVTERQKWLIQSIENAQSKIGDDGKMEVNLQDGVNGTIREGILVDGLIEELESISKASQQQANDLDDQITAALIAVNPGETARLQAKMQELKNEMDSLGELSKFLTDNSGGYYALHPEMVGDLEDSRKKLEANYISQDFRKTPDQDGDYYKAEDELKKRRELILPDITPKEQLANPVVAQVSEVKPELTETEKDKNISENKIEKPEGKAFVVDTTEFVKAYARRLAEDELNKILYPPKDESRAGRKPSFRERLRDAGKAFTNFGKAAFVRLGEEGYRKKFYLEALERIKNDKDLLVQIDARILHKSKGASTLESKQSTQDVLDSVIEEFQRNIVEADEKGELVNDPKVNQVASELFYGWATGKIKSREDFEKEVESQIIPLIKGKQFTNDNKRKGEAEGLMYANNFFQLAESYKGYISQEIEKFKGEYGNDQEEALKDFINSEMAFDIQLGLKQRDLYETKPEGTLKWYEKFVDATQKIPLLNKILANPIAYGVLGGIVGSMVGKGVSRAAAGVGLVTLAGVAPWLTPLILGAAFGGAYAGMRRSRDLAHDQGMDNRRATLGQEAGGDRTRKMREFGYKSDKYQAVTAESLTGELQVMQAKDALNDDEKHRVTEIIARLQIERERSVDLIGASAQEGARYGTKAIGMKDLKIALQEVQNKFGLSDQQLKGDIDRVKGALGQMIDAQDKAFKDYKRGESMKGGILGAGIGVAAGFLGQQVAHSATHWVSGLFGHEGPKGETAVEHIGHLIRGDKTYLSDKVHAVPFDWPGGEKTNINIPEGTSLQADGNHYNLVDDHGKVVFDDIKIDKDGFSQDTIDRLHAQGMKFEDNVTTTHKPSNALEDLKDKFQMEQHHRVDWHDELGKRFSEFFHKLIEFEGKQQMLYLEKDSNGIVWIDAKAVAENLIKNVEGAFDQFGHNPDGSVDTKLFDVKEQILQWNKDGTLFKHLQGVIIPNEEANKTGFNMLFEGAVGNKIPLSKEVSDLFTTPESLHYLHHPVKFIELRLDGHTLATSIGEDIKPVDVVQAIHNPTIIGSGSKWDVPPVVPMLSRYPLEPTKKPEAVVPPPYYNYLGGVERRKEREEFFRGRFSENLKNDHEANLDFTDEAIDYINRNEKQDKNYTAKMNDILSQPEIQKPMDDRCRAAICISAYDLGEGKVAEHALELYRNQITNGSVKPEEFELLIFLNHPKDKLVKMKIKPGAEERVRKGKPEAYDTEEVIKQYQQKHPELNIRVMKKEFDTRPPWGQIIKYNYDTAMMRSLNRKNPVNEDIIMITNDIDVRDMTDTYIRDTIDFFDKNDKDIPQGKSPKMDVLVGRIDFGQEIYKKWPNFFVATRFEQLIGSQLRQGYSYNDNEVGGGNSYVGYDTKSKQKSTRTSGDNTAIRGSIYCAIGGPNIESDCGADTELGDMINVARKSKDPDGTRTIEYKNRLWRDTDPRRQIETYKSGKPIVYAWGNWAGMTVYGKSFDEQIEGDEENLNKERLEFEFNAAIRVHGVSAEAKIVKRALHWLGFKDQDFLIQNNEIKILNLDNVKTNVDEWKPRRELWKTAKGRNPIRTKSLKGYG
jgi:hypothetical protein